MPSLAKIIVQADVHIRASTLFGIGLMLGVMGYHGQLDDGR